MQGRGDVVMKDKEIKIKRFRIDCVAREGVHNREAA